MAERSEAAQAAAGDRSRDDSKIAKARTALRSKLRTQELKAIFDELATADPGPDSLALVVAVVGVQVVEEQSALKRLRAAAKKRPAGTEYSELEEYLDCQEVRRTSRHLKPLLDSVTRAVKVRGDLGISTAPKGMVVRGTVKARMRLVSSGDAQPAEEPSPQKA